MKPYFPKSNSLFRGSLSFLFLIFILFFSFSTQVTAQCDADSGTFSAQQLCFGSMEVNLTAVPAGDTVVPAGFDIIYVLTGGDGLIILDVNADPTFTVTNPAGRYTIHTLVYDASTLDLGIVVPGETTGFDVNALLIQGGGDICAALDVTGAQFLFGGCDDGCPAEAGTLIAAATADLADSTAVLTATIDEAPAVPTGYQVLYVLTSGADLVIEQTSASPSFTVNREGLFTIHTLVYDPNTLDLSIVVPGTTTGVDVNNLLIQGGGDICAALDVAGAPIEVTACTAEAGTLTAAATADLADSTAVLTATIDEAPAVPAGYQVLYVLTSGADLVIEQTNDSPSFTVNREGLFTIHTLVYDPNTLDLSIVVPGTTTGVDVNNLLIQGGGDICAALDVAGAPIEVTACTAEAGTLTAAATADLADSTAVLTATIDEAPAVPAGYQVLYVLTSGADLVIEQTNASPSFTVNREGLFTIHTLVYDPNTLDLSIVVPGTTTGVDVNNLLIQGGGDICAALDVAGAPIEVTACTAEAGTLTAAATADLADSTAVLTATIDEAPAVPTGYQVLYVLTSGADLVIEQTNDSPSFTVNREGLFTIHTLVYDPNTLDLSIVVPGTTTGVDVNNLLIQGGGDICAALDVAGAPIEVTACSAEAGTLRANTDGICLDSDGTATLTATRDAAANVPDGYELLYVLTSGEGLVIEATSTEPTFEVESEGMFTIHTLVYDPNTLDLGIVVPGETTGFDVNGLLVQGGGDICAALDVAGAKFTVKDCSCGVTAGRLGYTRSGGSLVCLDGNGRAFLAANVTQIPNVLRGYEKIYVLTSGNNLVIQKVNHIPVFVVDNPGRYTIHTLVYNPATLDLGIIQLGFTTGFEVNALLKQGGGDICAALDVAGVKFTVQDCGTHSLQAFPNPTVDYINIDLPKVENTQQIFIQVMDRNGNVVKEVQLDGNTERAKIDMLQEMPGAYYLHVMYDNQLMQQMSVIKAK